MKCLLLMVFATLLFPAVAFGNECDIRVEKAVVPNFPIFAMATKVSGDIVVRVTVDRSGAVFKSRGITEPKHIHSFLEDYAKYWEFSKADEKSVQSCNVREMDIIFSFTLLPSDTKRGPSTQSNFTYPNKVNIIAIEPDLIHLRTF